MNFKSKILISLAVIGFAISVFAVIKAFSTEETVRFTVNALDLAKNQRYPNGTSSSMCHAEYTGRMRDAGEEPGIVRDQMASLYEIALNECTKELYIGIPLKQLKVSAEGLYIPLWATLPYELAKPLLALSDNNQSAISCADAVEPILMACPAHTSMFIKKVHVIDR